MAANVALWRLLLSIDLTRRLSFDRAAVDEALLRLVDEPGTVAAAGPAFGWRRAPSPMELF